MTGYNNLFLPAVLIASWFFVKPFPSCFSSLVVSSYALILEVKAVHSLFVMSNLCPKLFSALFRL